MITTPPRFTRAILRQPCPEMVDGLTSADLGLPDYALACAQHAAYADALRACGLKVRVLPADHRFPDSCFVEDVALCTPRGAIVTRPGAPSRRDEAAGMADILAPFFPVIAAVTAPGTVEAGDIMMVGDTYYIGISARTNAEGAAQAIDILRSWGLEGKVVPLSTMLHLKTGLSYLEQGRLLTFGEFKDHPEFVDFTRYAVPEEEAYAANCIWVNGHVLIPAGYPQTLAWVTSMGYTAVPLAMSEFQKLDGGLSCLSLRF
jgi:dimethylargininase